MLPHSPVAGENLWRKRNFLLPEMPFLPSSTMLGTSSWAVFSLWNTVMFWILTASVQFSLVQLLSHVQLFATPWTAACQVPLSVTNSRHSPKLVSIESVMPPSHLILCHPLSLLPSIFPSIRVFSSEPALRMRWPKYWSFSFSISPSKEHPGLISFRMECFLRPC